MSRRLLVGLMCVLGSACVPPSEPELLMSPDKSSFDGRTQRVTLRVSALDELGAPAGGIVTLETAVGAFVGGDSQVLVEGAASFTYACNPDEQLACLGGQRITARWNGLTRITQVIGVRVEPQARVQWQVVPTGVPATLHAAARASNGLVWAVGDQGTVLRLIDGAWQAVPSGVRSALRAMAVSARGELAVVGDDGVILVWQRGGFVEPAFERLPEHFTAVAFDARGELIIGARSGKVFRANARRIELTLAMSSRVESLVNQGGVVWATAEGELVSDQNGWKAYPSPTNGTIRRAFAGTDELWLGGERRTTGAMQGLLVTGDVPQWRITALETPVRGFVEVPGVDERFVIGAGVVLRQLAASAWNSAEAPLVSLEAGVSRGANDLVLVGAPGISLLRVP